MRNVSIILACGILTPLLVASKTPGLDIQITFDAARSLPEDFPSFDPDASLLGGIVQYVAGVYEDIIEDNHVLELSYRWDRDLAEMNPPITTGLHTLLGQSGSRETSAMIRFDPDPAWFIDPTPDDDSEFDMALVLFGDMDSTQQGQRFNGNVPDTFEAGYLGSASSTAPTAAQNNFDLVSLVFHEMGHALGMSGNLNSTINETADGDYDVRPSFVGGNIMAERVRNMTNNGRAHLFGGNTGLFVGPSLMSRLTSGERRRPSAGDIFAMSGPSIWLDIDLRRIQFLSGSAFWHNGISWLGGKIPDGNDAVWISTGEAALMGDQAIAGELTVDNGSTLFTTGHLLWAIDKATVGGDGEGEVIVGGLLGPVDGGSFHGDQLAVNFNGTVRLSGGNTAGNEAKITFSDVALAGTLVTNVDTWGVVSSATEILSGATTTVATNAQLSLNGNLRGAADLTKSGDGLLVLNGNNGAWAGDLLLQQGTVNFDSVNSLSSTTTLVLADSTTADFRAQPEVFGALAGSGQVLLGTTNIFLSKHVTVGVNNTSTLFTGRVSGGRLTRFTKAGRGTMTLGSGGIVGVDEFAVVDGGTLAVDGATMSAEQIETLADFGPFGTVNGSTLRLASGSLTAMNLNINPANRLQVTGGSLDAGTIAVVDGFLDIAGGEVVATQIDLQFNPQNRIGGFEMTGGRLQVGTFNGDLVIQGGTLAPGASAGTTNVNGSYTQRSAATLEIEIAGTVMGTDYDFVDVTGNVGFDGTLQLILQDGFVPASTDEFTILSASSLSGSFDNVGNGGRLDLAGATGSFLVHYGIGSVFDPNHIVLSDFEAASADLDGDGDVDGDDFLAIQRTNPALIPLWEAQFGTAGTVSSNMIATPGATIPEPSSGGALVMAFATYSLYVLGLSRVSVRGARRC